MLIPLCLRGASKGPAPKMKVQTVVSLAVLVCFDYTITMRNYQKSYLYYKSRGFTADITCRFSWQLNEILQVIKKVAWPPDSGQLQVRTYERGVLHHLSLCPLHHPQRPCYLRVPKKLAYGIRIPPNAGARNSPKWEIFTSFGL